MDYRAPLGGRQRPLPPQRAVSGPGPQYGGLSHPPIIKRPTLPSGLSNVRSVSQPTGFADLTLEGKSGDVAFWGKRGDVVGSPGVITVEDDDDGPPAKRAKIAGASFREENEDEQDEAHKITPGSPLPSLPKTKPDSRRSAAQRRHPFNIEPSARKAHGLDPPAVATRIPPPKKAADFSPWTGNHPEDVLNENVIKTGFFDKLPGTNQTESNSAKATISSTLSQKNSHGLSLLGYIFTAVLEKRHVLGKCTAPSTFKPPPRVTVTDTKREAWLRDLANPDIPLRKQSRTIPHGIRGKLLMEQCLSKDIPLQRAVWLAKCVGANELRAFRRKGISHSAAASSESKWVREWTVHVEQFLEDLIAACGTEGWQRKMNYAVKLATTFYSESILDAEHYLDWIVSSLAEASLERVPVWIVLAQIHWRDIMMYGLRGRRLAEGVLEHLHQITTLNRDCNAPLKIRLQKLVAVLAASNRGCLILPRTWERYKGLLTPEVVSSAADTPANNIKRRNERLAAPLVKNAKNTRSPLLNLYAALDSVGLDLNVESLAERCLNLVPETSKLIAALFDWASTRYRIGISRVYLTARIVAHLHDTGHDTGSAILRYLGNTNALPASNADHVHKVIIELVRLEVFSIGRYLQWLIASGVISAGTNATCATSLITALPETNLPVHVLNTKKTLMRRLGYAVDERSMSDEVLENIDQAISRSATEHVETIHLPEDLSLAASFGVTQRLCAHLSSTAKESSLSLEAFALVRAIVENVGDITSLSLLLTAAITTDNPTLLATISDTINTHASTLSALNYLHPLVDRLADHYVHFRSQQPLDRTLILALTSLAQRSSEKASFIKLLNNDLAICDQQSSLAACSPASDSLIGMHAGSLDSDDDIDAVFASGNTMDEGLMLRVFTRIMHRAVKPMPPGLDSTSRICGWLNQLRVVDGGGGVFERLLLEHVRLVVKGAEGVVYGTSSIVWLVASGCLTLRTAAETAAQEVESPAPAVELLQVFLSAKAADVGLSETERYRYRLHQLRFEEEHLEVFNALLRLACQHDGFDPVDAEVLAFVVRYFTGRKGEAHDLFSSSAKESELLHANVSRILSGIVFSGRDDTSEANGLLIARVVSAATPLSIQFCAEAIQHFKHGVSFGEADERAFGDAVLDAFANQSDVWPQLLEVAGDAVNREAHEWARDQLLLYAMDQNGLEDDAAHQHVQRCLELLAVTSTEATRNDDSTTATTITERLKELEKGLSSIVGFKTGSDGTFGAYLDQLCVSLHLCVMHVHALPDENEQSKQARTNLLASLCGLLIHPRLQSHADSMEYLFDLTSTLADNLGEASQAALKLLTSTKTPLDNRLVSILGPNPTALDTQLVLASQVQPPGSQQQRALNKHPSQQLQRTSGPVQPQHHRMPSQGASRQDSRMPVEVKMTPFALRRWEIMPDPTPVMGENDGSLSLGLFGARKV